MFCAFIHSKWKETKKHKRSPVADPEI